MTIEDFLKNGATIPNPNYKKPSKRNPAGSPKFITSDNYGDSLEYGNRLGQHLAANSYDLTHLNTGTEKWDEYGVHINPVNTEEELQKERANNQSAFEQATYSLGQAVGNEVLLGTFLGLSNLVDAAVNITKDKGENDYTNPVSQFLEGLQDDVRQSLAIYRKDPNASWALGDFGWWADNAVSVASSASMLIPSTGVVKGISLLGKVKKIGEFSSKATRLIAKTAKAVTRSTKSTERLAKSISAGTEIGATALLSRTMENYLEARGVYNEVKDNTLKKINAMSAEEKQQMINRNPELEGKSDEEMAGYIAGASADVTFKNDYAMLLMDIAQFKAIGTLWKGVKTKTPTGRIRAKNKQSIDDLVKKPTLNGSAATETAEKTASKLSESSSWINDRLKSIKENFKHPLTTAGAIEWGEGFEEGYQGIQTEKGKEVAEMILDPNYTPRTVASYIKDPSIWEQAFWGVVGGVVFPHVAKPLGKLWQKADRYIDYKKGKLSEQEFKNGFIGDEKTMANEIEGRASLNADFIEKMQLLNGLKNPNKPVVDEEGKVKKDEDDNIIYEALTPEGAEIQKAQVLDDYLTKLALNSVDSGTWDLLKEYVSSNEFDQMFKEAGLELTGKDKAFSQRALDRMEEIVNNYETNLYNVLSNTEVENEAVARLISRELTQEQIAIDEYEEQHQILQDKINKLNTGDEALIDDYKRRAVVNYVRNQLDKLDVAEQKMYNDYNAHKITEQAKKQYLKDFNERRQSLYRLVDNVKDNGLQQVKDLINKFKLDGKLTDTDIAANNTAFAAIESVLNGTAPTGTLSESIKKLVDRQIQLEDGITYTRLIKPETKEGFIERANQVEEQVGHLAVKRINDAATKVENYIKSQEDLNKATEDVISGKVDELKDALDILKLGYHRTDFVYKSIIATVNEERAKREKAKKEAEKVKVDGNTSASNQAANVQAGVAAATAKAEENGNVANGSQNGNPSTGNKTQASPADIKRLLDEAKQSIMSTQTKVQPVSERNPHATYYLIDGKEYTRVHGAMGDVWIGQNSANKEANSERALISGSMIDVIVRDYFNGATVTKPAGITDSAFNSLINSLNNIRENMQKEGEIFLTNNIVLYHEFPNGVRIAGEADIISIKIVNGEPQYNIYDLKTSSGGRYGQTFTESPFWETSNAIGSRNTVIGTKEQYTNQVSLYKLLFERMMKEKVTNLGLLPYKLVYDAENNIIRIEKKDGIPLSYNPNVEKIVAYQNIVNDAITEIQNACQGTFSSSQLNTLKGIIINGVIKNENFEKDIEFFINNQNITNIDIALFEPIINNLKHKISTINVENAIKEKSITTNIPTRTPEEEAALASLTPELQQGLEEAAKATVPDEAPPLTVDQRSKSIAMDVAANLNKTSPNLFENVIDKDVDSPEVQRLIDAIYEGVIEKGVTPSIAKEAAKRGAYLALGSLSRHMKQTNNPKADAVRKLADSILLKHKIDDSGTMAAITTTLSNTELNTVIDDFLAAYVAYKNIETPNGQKPIISLERLFHDIVYDENLNMDIDTAMHILYNMKDYINNILNRKYEFTQRRSLNALLKNPTEFFNAITNNRLVETQLDNYMHIAPSTRETDEYKALIAALRGGEDVEISYSKDPRGNNYAISFKVNGKEIGYISLVEANNDNNGFTLRTSATNGGIIWEVHKEDDMYRSSSETLFDAIFGNEEGILDIIEKKRAYLINSANEDITTDEAKAFLETFVIKDAIEKGIIKMPKKYVLDPSDGKYHLVDIHNTPREKANFIIKSIHNILFYDPLAQLPFERVDSYHQWLKNLYTNYSNTARIQEILDKQEKNNSNEKITAILAGMSNGYNNESTDIRTIIDDSEHDITELGLMFDKNPIVAVVNDNGNTVLVNEGNGKTMSSAVPFPVGTMGMLIGGREDTPILALFDSNNKVQGKLKKQLMDELTDIFTGYQNGTYSYEQVYKKLTSLLNGPGIGAPTIFQGYSVVEHNNSLALCLNGDIKKYTVIINKFKKGTSDPNTSIIYSKNGDVEQARASVKPDNIFIAELVNELADNITYNKTFFTIKNIGKDNTNDNPYMYKENGKFVIEIGGVKTVYENFGDFVLKENAFKTYQGRNKQGGFFNNTDKINSLYIDVATVGKPVSKTSPVEGEPYQSIEETITSIKKDEKKPTKELLVKAGIDQAQVDFLTGDNVYGISLIPEVYGFDNRLTGEIAVTKGTEIFFSKVGAKHVGTNAKTLRRILIHENFHKRFREKRLFERKKIVEDLFDTYNQTVAAIDKVLNTAKKTSDEYKKAKALKNWLETNHFNPVDYFTNTKFGKNRIAQYAAMTQEQRNQIFAEEWLVESITQSDFVEFLNSTEYIGQEVIVEGLANEKKSLWQKIIDLLLKLFNINGGNVKNNTIFAKQYLIVADESSDSGNAGVDDSTNDNTQDNTTNNITATQDNGETNVPQDNTTAPQESADDTNVGEDTTDVPQDDYGLFDEENEEAFNGEYEEDEDNNEIDDYTLNAELNNTDDLEMLAITSDITEYNEEQQEILNNANRDAEGHLLAPNGKPSNLNERQWIHVRTKAFKEWFGDWENDPANASKVIDENGEPLVVYHGTTSEFSDFNYNDDREYSDGFYFTSDKEYAKNIASNKGQAIIMPVFLNIRNPIITDTPFIQGKMEGVYVMEGNKYSDGVIGHDLDTSEYENIIPSKGVEYHVTRPNKIKSAIDNNDNYSTTDNNIYAAVTSDVEDYILDHVDNDGNVTAETFNVIRVTNMANYLNMYPVQFKPLIAKMLANGEIRYSCKIR